MLLALPVSILPLKLTLAFYSPMSLRSRAVIAGAVGFPNGMVPGKCLDLVWKSLWHDTANSILWSWRQPELGLCFLG